MHSYVTTILYYTIIDQIKELTLEGASDYKGINQEEK
jgi:PII-like signaling protein